MGAQFYRTYTKDEIKATFKCEFLYFLKINLPEK